LTQALVKMPGDHFVLNMATDLTNVEFSKQETMP